jgi:acyl dehydratase
VRSDLATGWLKATLPARLIQADLVKPQIVGGTIAHGFLTLALLSAMAYEAVPEINGAEIGLNYGFNALRFVSAVKAGSSVRGRFTLLDVIERRPGQWQSTFKVVVDILDADKPALTAEWLNLVIIP